MHQKLVRNLITLYLGYFLDYRVVRPLKRTVLSSSFQWCSFWQFWQLSASLTGRIVYRVSQKWIFKLKIIIFPVFWCTPLATLHFCPWNALFPPPLTPHPPFSRLSANFPFSWRGGRGGVVSLIWMEKCKKFPLPPPYFRSFRRFGVGQGGCGGLSSGGVGGWGKKFMNFSAGMIFPNRLHTFQGQLWRPLAA